MAEIETEVAEVLEVGVHGGDEALEELAVQGVVGKVDREALDGPGECLDEAPR